MRNEIYLSVMLLTIFIFTAARGFLPSWFLDTHKLILFTTQLESVDASERKWACVAVSNLIQNDPSTRRLLQGKNIVGALITRLSDSEEEVVVEAAGSLR